MAVVKKIEPITVIRERKKRVAAYARVSMETDMLMHSLAAQISHYSALIQSNPEWEFAGIYSDDGITGTSISKRTDFKSLIADCEAGKIDVVLVKSISRFARDTVDTLNTTRRLREIGVDVFFEREHIHSISCDGELMLTLLASFAQEESRSISGNIKWSIRKRFEEGIPNGHKPPYGYKWDGDIFRIIPEQGEVVRRIYREYLGGSSAYAIAAGLEGDGILGQTGVPMDDSTVKDILSSTSYTGTMVLQKSFKTDAHIRRKNRGELPRYAVSEMFEPLVSEEDFRKAQEIRRERAESIKNANPELTPFSGRIKCGGCGCSVSRRNSQGRRKWVCNTRERKGVSVCQMRPIYESELTELTARALGTDDYDAETARRLLRKVTLHHDRLEFTLDNGRTKCVERGYSIGHSGFSGRLECGICGGKLKADNWKGRRVWLCRGCTFKRIYETEIRDAVTRLYGKGNCDAVFLGNVERAVFYNDRYEFYDRKGERHIWQRG